MLEWLVLPTLLVLAPLSDDAVYVEARIDAPMLVVGNEYTIQLSYFLEDGLYASKSGIPHPILQIKAPPSVELTGPVLDEHRELMRNEFLQAPYERLLEKRTTKIGFKLVKKPAASDAFSLNFIAYVGSKPEAGRFVRRRVTLPVAAKAKSRPAPPIPSNWGDNDNNLLTVGESAAPFDLPRTDGTRVSLANFRGKKNVIIMTYRAHW